MLFSRSRWLPGHHKGEYNCEEDSSGIVFWRAPPNDVELLQQQQELLPRALAVGRVEGQRLAAFLGNWVLFDHLLWPPAKQDDLSASSCQDSYSSVKSQMVQGWADHPLWQKERFATSPSVRKGHQICNLAPPREDRKWMVEAQECCQAFTSLRLCFKVWQLTLQGCSARKDQQNHGPVFPRLTLLRSQASRLL